MSWMMQRTMRRGLLAAGGTLMGAVVARKWLPREGHAEDVPPPAAPRPATPGSIQPHAPAAVPAFGFTDAAGKARTLADYRGRGVVLNFWATWCIPCVAELPSLARLAAAAAPKGIDVLPVSVDRGGADVAARFFKAHGIDGLPVLSDAHSTGLSALGLDGIPTTLLIGRDGLERARVQGAVDWDAPGSLDTLVRLLG
jgi:thiol-disulfide isomerase/thioredoxin